MGVFGWDGDLRINSDVSDISGDKQGNQVEYMIDRAEAGEEALAAVCLAQSRRGCLASARPSPPRPIEAGVVSGGPHNRWNNEATSRE